MPSIGRISAETSRRIRNLGFICSLLVCALHASWPYEGTGLIARRMFQFVLGPAAVPFFFMVSGFFLASHFEEDGWWKLEVRKRVSSLVIPYLLWAVIFLMFQAFCDGFHSWTRGGGFTIPLFRGLSWPKWISALGLDVMRRPQLGVLWYVRCLMFFVLISPAIFRFVRRIRFPGLLLAFPIILAYTTAFDPHIPERDPSGFFIYGLSLEGLWYFSLGSLLRFRPVKVPIHAQWVAVSVAVVLLTALSLGLVPDLVRPVSLVVFSTPFVLYSLWTLTPESAWPAALVSCAFPVYLLHTFFNYTVAWFTTHFFGIVSKVPGLSFALVSMCSIFVALAIHHFVPKTGKVLFGGR